MRCRGREAFPAGCSDIDHCASGGLNHIVAQGLAFVHDAACARNRQTNHRLSAAERVADQQNIIRVRHVCDLQLDTGHAIKGFHRVNEGASEQANTAVTLCKGDLLACGCQAARIIHRDNAQSRIRKGADVSDIHESRADGPRKIRRRCVRLIRIRGVGDGLADSINIVPNGIFAEVNR